MLTPEPAGIGASGGARARALMDDQSGAIMVLGIFMCSVIAGLLWYVAGIGDAIVYRERMQEASDAVAFSGATLHARGMNLIVLLNLLMACILAVRVALKMLVLALRIVTVIFTGIAAIPIFGTWAIPIPPITTAAGNVVQSVQTELDPIIDELLVALHTLETVVARIVPPAALLGSFQVGSKYKPAVKEAGAVALAAVKDGLPVEDGTEDMLCGKAGEAVGTVIAWPLSMVGLSAGASLLEGLTSKIAKAGAAYFCGMGSGGSAPNLDDIFNEQANDMCNTERDGLQKDYSNKSQDWHTACGAVNPPATCVDPDPFGLGGGVDEATMTYDDTKLTLSQIANLQSKMNETNTAYQKVKQFKKDECKTKKKQQMKQASQTSQTSSSNSGNKKPMQVKKNWQNGVQDAQLLSLAKGDISFLKPGAKGVKVGAFKDRRQKDAAEPKSSEYAFAQAEFFYDCSGGWDTSDCNNEDSTHQSAMWHFKWRARLRRYTAPNQAADFIIRGAAGELDANALRMRPTIIDPVGNVPLIAEIAPLAKGVIDPKSIVFH